MRKYKNKRQEVGMVRLKRDIEYDADKIMKELIAAVSESYEQNKELKTTANEFGMSALKIRKLLITAGVYKNELSDEINNLYDQGKTLVQIMEITGLKKSSINGYLPYTKAVYKPEKISRNAERIKVYRNRQKAVLKLQKELNEETLWSAVVSFQNYPFYTYSGLPFSYTLKVGRDGTFNKELFVDRMNESKSLAWSSVLLAFEKALKVRGEIVEKPKAIGDIRGISYIYSMFCRFGIIKKN